MPMSHHASESIMSDAEAGPVGDPSLAAKGSRRWLQILVEQRPELLHAQLQSSLQLAEGESIDWRSPRASDRYKEYQDMKAVAKLDVSSLARRQLSAFWPARGPVWDALGVSSGGKRLLVEAKAHIAEAASRGTAATGDSLLLIQKSLEEARRFYAPRASARWDGLFYQYANRLAHLYFLRELNQIPAHLVFIYFLNDSDMGGPASADEWRGAIELLHASLGLVRSLERHGVHDVFIDVKELQG